LTAAFLSTAYFGCSPSSDTGPPPVEESKRDTPDNLMLFLARAYRDKDMDDYYEALDESFLFLFTEEVATELGLPPDEPWWGKTEEVTSTGNMFDSPNVTDIVFSYEAVGLDWDPVTEAREDTTFSGLFRRFDPLIEVTTLVEEEDPILKYRVNESWLDITVVPDRFTEGLWTILKIEESHKQL
jgi:hypothetical protein